MPATSKPKFLKTAKEVVSEITKRAPSLAQKPKTSVLKLADDLYTFRSLKRDGSAFRNLAERSGISQRKAYHLADIARKLEDYWDAERFEAIGWTKLCMISARVKDDTASRTVEHWLKFAESHTARECQLHLDDQPFEQETRCMLLRLDERQYAKFAKAVMKHGAKKRGKGLSGVEKALMSIIRKVSQADAP